MYGPRSSHLSHAVRRRWRLSGVSVLLLTLAVLLSGCMRVARTLSLKGDGSGTYVLAVGFRQPQQGDPNSVSANIVTTMEAFGAHVQQQGGSYRRYDEQGYTYWAYTRPFTSVAQANMLLQEDPRQDDSSHFPLLYRDSLHITQSAGLFTTTFHVSGAISLVDILNNGQNWQDATETLTITMPAGVSAHQGGASDGSGVTYTIAYNQSAKVDVTGSVSNATGVGVALAAVIALLALALLGVGVRLLRASARKR
jgi:hypothetical protein